MAFSSVLSRVSSSGLDVDSSSTVRANSPASVRHPEFWLYDGSVVLAVEKTLFRVHQTILANHSEVFADLFTIPQPDGEFMIDGCHIVQLYDDENDFSDLLKAVYRPDHLDTLPLDADLDTLMNFISGILKLSTKYMIRYLRQRCIALLLTKLPATFESYQAKSHSTNPTSSLSPPTPSPDRYRSDTVMRAIKLAQENNVLEALPYAYYCVSRFPHKRLLKERPGDISWKDKAICLVGRERLGWAQMSMSYSFLLVFQRSPTCQSLLCAHARSPHAEWHALENARSPHPLREFEGWDRLNICPDCVAYCKQRHLAGRQEVWNHLPTLFELQSWEELKKIQNM
ncbi:hypothetical protein CPB83DRAFT_899627 [Crepidotus variabilis]|uniref:BTB domain-containing protein n=1 Tax=Crepidotus variabilis TaxID=179855 RepID=A0A9P6E4Q5_9AGAR|nr:hypothetical protein CPB83DRAFT_899627 [Crepidotus variabilis]